MKPSPENTSPVSRLNARRQLDLCSDLPEYLRIPDSEDKTAYAYNDRLTLDNSDLSDAKHPATIEPSDRNVHEQEVARRNCTMSNNNNCLTNTCVSNASQAAANVSERHSQGKVTTCPATIHNTPNCSQLTPSCQQAISAFESRRISNQLARAQFLAGTPACTNQGRNIYAKNMFRARSESPQNSATQSVSRSPSVPTLETAL